MQSQVQSPTEIVSSNVKPSEESEAGPGGRKWAEDSEVVKGGVNLKRMDDTSGIRMPEIKIDVSRASINQDDQPSSIREQVPLHLNN